MYPAWATIPSGTPALFSESPDPIMSGTITRNRDDSSGPRSRQTNDDCGNPWIRTTTGPSPSSV